MNDVKRLLTEATPLPWRWLVDSGSVMLWGANGDPGGEGHVLTPHACPACAERGARCLNFSEADEALVTYAVNRLPDYEAAVDAANEVMALLDTERERIVPHLLDTDDNPGERLRAVLIRLRSVPA